MWANDGTVGVVHIGAPRLELFTINTLHSRDGGKMAAVKPRPPRRWPVGLTTGATQVGGGTS